MEGVFDGGRVVEKDIVFALCGSILAYRHLARMFELNIYSESGG
jgi:hypothetical protein